jgi:hypothetical protein
MTLICPEIGRLAAARAGEPATHTHQFTHAPQASGHGFGRHVRFHRPVLSVGSSGPSWKVTPHDRKGKTTSGVVGLIWKGT